MKEFLYGGCSINKKANNGLIKTLQLQPHFITDRFLETAALRKQHTIGPQHHFIVTLIRKKLGFVICCFIFLHLS